VSGSCAGWESGDFAADALCGSRSVSAGTGCGVAVGTEVVGAGCHFDSLFGAVFVSGFDGEA
jgi:hypothetical protein